MKALPYFQGTGRRKTSIARVRLVPGEGAVVVNGKPLDDYFARDGATDQALLPFTVTSTARRFNAMVKVEGGGVSGQIGAIAHGISRALPKVHFEEEDRTGALRVLRDGAAALTKSGERSAAIGLLRQAIVLDPRDLSTHRRLAAALALAGDTDASVQEYARFIRDLRDSGESQRAKNEVAWAKGQLRGVSGVSTLDAIADGAPAKRDEPAEPEVQEPTEDT